MYQRPKKPSLASADAIWNRNLRRSWGDPVIFRRLETFSLPAAPPLKKAGGLATRRLFKLQFQPLTP
jgi:hypothetical protein